MNYTTETKSLIFRRGSEFSQGIVKHSVCTKHFPRCRTCDKVVPLPGQMLLSAATCFHSCCHQAGCFLEAAGSGWFKPTTCHKRGYGGLQANRVKRCASDLENLTVSADFAMEVDFHWTSHEQRIYVEA